MPVAREMVSGYVRRFGGWTRLCSALAAELGVDIGEVCTLDAGGAPVAFVEAWTQHGDFGLRLEVFVDTTRAPGYRGKAALLAGLARALGEDVLFDDGASTNPYRWVLVRSDGALFEVFEDARVDPPFLVLDRRLGQRRLDEQ